jgi:hypothetical protein
MTRRAWLLLIGAVAGAQIVRPKLGYIVDRNGSLRRIEGVAGAFSIGVPIDHNVISAAYSGKLLAVKKERELILNGKAFEAPAGPAKIVFTSAGNIHRVFYPDAGVLWTFSGGDSFEETFATDLDDVTFVRDGELTVRGLPLRLASRVQRFSQMGEDWLVAYGEDRMFAIRGGQVLEIPEDSE